jgi:hypothetical protein
MARHIADSGRLLQIVAAYCRCCPPPLENFSNGRAINVSLDKSLLSLVFYHCVEAPLSATALFIHLLSSVVQYVDQRADIKFHKLRFFKARVM